MKNSIAFVILCFYGAISFASSQSQEMQVHGVKEAVSRYICFQVYWLGWTRRQGISRPLQLLIEGDQSLSLPYKIKADGKMFMAWIEGIEIFRGDPIDQFLIGRLKNDSPAVILSEGYNANLTPPLRSLLENRSRFATNQATINESITIPQDCTPRYDRSTPQKELMLRTIVATMEKRLSFFVKAGLAKYPQELTLIIGNFNVDYPSTYVLVEPSDQTNGFDAELYDLTLHDAQDYDSDRFERQGEYPLGEVRIRPEQKQLLQKIRERGIKQKIALSP